MAKLTINLPNRPKGDPIELPGAGLYPNGYSFDVADMLTADLLVGVEEAGETYADVSADKLAEWRQAELSKLMTPPEDAPPVSTNVPTAETSQNPEGEQATDSEGGAQ